MSQETRELIAWVIGTLAAGAAAAGWCARYIVLPWLRANLVNPVEHVKKQVTENQHSNKVPTVLDRLDDVQEAVATLTLKVEAAHLAANIDRARLETHLGWSHEEVNRIWHAIVERYTGLKPSPPAEDDGS